MVQNLGWFKEIIIIKNLKSNDIDGNWKEGE